MSIKRITIWAALCCLSFVISAGAARAQMGGMGMARNIPTMGGVFNPTVGVGADYDMTTSKGEQMKMSWAIIGKDSIDGKPGYWIEIGFSGGKMPGTMYMKSLSVVDASGQMATERMIMQMNGQAYQMPDQMVKMNSRSTQTNIASDGQNLGTETVTVPAGTFTADHWRSKDGGDFWVAKDAGPWEIGRAHV